MENANWLKKDRAAKLDRMKELLDHAEEQHRDLTTTESAEFRRLEKECDLLTTRIEQAEAAFGIRSAAPPRVPLLGDDATGPGKHFRSLGEQLKAIVTAGTPGGATDARLHEVAAEARASGMHEAVGTEGGFLLESTFALDLLTAGMAAAKLAPRCASFPVGARSNSIELPVVDESSRATGSRFGGLKLYWLTEAAPKTETKPKLRKLKLELKKLAGLCYASDELLEDATVLEAFLRRAFASEFAFVIDDCIIRGTGAGQPLGILHCPALVTVPEETGQAGDTITAANVLAMYSRLLASSVENAIWVYNQDAFPQLCSMTLTAGTAGQPMFVPAGGLSGRPYNSLLGLPLIAMEQCSTLGQPGDLILLDPSRYLLATKGGLQIASSIHIRFSYDETCFRFVYRLDGQPELSSPVTPYQGTATQSAYVTLAERA